MANWEIRSESERNKEAVDRWGQQEWNARLAVVQKKCDELEKEFGWEERCIVGTQFEPIARVVKAELWAKLVEQPVSKWRALVFKLAS